MAVRTKIFKINGQELELVYKREFLKFFPFSVQNIYKLQQKKIIPSSMFFSHGYMQESKFALYELYTKEHCYLLASWLALVSNNYTRSLRPTVKQTAYLHVEWRKLDDMFKEKYGIEAESNVSDAMHKYLAVDLHVIHRYIVLGEEDGTIEERYAKAIDEVIKKRTDAYNLQYNEGDVHTAFDYVKKRNFTEKNKSSGKGAKKL